LSRSRNAEDSGLLAHYRRGLGAALRHNQVAYAYSVMATATFGALAKLDGMPNVADCFLYLVGAGVAFALINVAVTRGFSERLPREPSEVVALGTALSLFSTAAALGIAALIGWVDGGAWPAWLVGPFLATLVFVLGAGGEMGLAGWHHDAGGVAAADED
jgi:hypothetical protein